MGARAGRGHKVTGERDWVRHSMNPRRGKKADREFWGLELNLKSKSHNSAQITAEKMDIGKG